MEIVLILYIALIVLMIASQWKLYVKAGEPGWAAIIPIYNMIVLLKIIGKPTWWIVLMLIPVVNLIFAIWAVNLLAKSFGKDSGFTLGMIFLPFIFYPVLAFGDAQYLGPQSSEALRNRDMNSL
ncbi:MAG TPA: DUF5684 domain-containing protein [Chitinophagaceae bacterium]|nr:DUF5684 domain-containing protein [Chitinophagaceae bacterium]